MTQDEIGRIAEAVAGRLETSDKLADAIYQKLKTNAFSELATKEGLKGLGDHLTRMESDMKSMKETVDHLSDAWDNWQGAV